MAEEPIIKTPAELDKEYNSEVKKTARKLQLADFVSFFYQNVDNMSFYEIIEEYKKNN